jgi:hypothetical protein
MDLINVLHIKKDVFKDSNIVDTIIGKVVNVNSVIWSLKHFGYKCLSDDDKHHKTTDLISIS